jgi:NAD(P)-dependent dehydrogenase (short-subunit alcohol dehydrogenase family)
MAAGKRAARVYGKGRVMKSSVIVIGASGGVGSGVVQSLLAGGYPVVAVGRHRDTLLRLAERFGRPPSLTVLPASVESDSTARDLVQQLAALRRSFAGAIVAIGPPRDSGRLMERDGVFLEDRLHAQVVTRFIAARHLIPFLAGNAPNALYLGIASAAAAQPGAGQGHCAIASAALGMLARVLHAENRELPVRVQQLTLAPGDSTDGNATDAAAVGRAALDLLQHSDGSAALLALDAGGRPEPVE